MSQGERLLRQRVGSGASTSSAVPASFTFERGIAMPTRTLDPESLAVESFATAPAIVVPEADEAAASRTSCPGPPYCTC
jgi:hypothetical protein